MKNKITLNILIGLLLTTSVSCLANPLYSSTKEQVAMDNTIKLQKLDLTTKWDKTFKKSEKVVHSKVTFANRYGITLAADLYLPKVDSKEATPKFPAIVVKWDRMVSLKNKFPVCMRKLWRKKAI